MLPHPSKQELAQYLNGLGIEVVVHSPDSVSSMNADAGPFASSTIQNSLAGASCSNAAACIGGNGSVTAEGSQLWVEGFTGSDILPMIDQSGNVTPTESLLNAYQPANGNGRVTPPPADARSFADGLVSPVNPPAQPFASRSSKKYKGRAVKYQGMQKDYPRAAQQALGSVLRAGLLDDITPREVKRMLNRYLLAKYIILEQVGVWTMSRDLYVSSVSLDVQACVKLQPYSVFQGDLFPYR